MERSIRETQSRKRSKSILSIKLMSRLMIVSAFSFAIMEMANCFPAYAKDELTMKSDKSISMPQEVKRFKLGSFVNAVAWSADGSRLASLSNWGSVITVWDVKTWSVIKEFHRYSGTYAHNSFCFLPDGSLITATPVGKSPDPRYVDLSKSFSLIQWDINSGQPTGYFPDVASNRETLASGIVTTNKFVVSDDGSLVAGVGSANVLFVYSTKDRALLYKLSIQTNWPVRDHTELITSLSFSPDSHELAIGTGSDSNSPTEGGGKVYFYDALSGHQLHSFWAYKKDPRTGDAYEVYSLAYSPNGEFIATGKRKILNTKTADDVAVNIWSAKDGASVAELKGKITTFTGKTEIFGSKTLSWFGDILVSGEGSALRMWSMKNPSSPKLIEAIDPTPNVKAGGSFVYSTAFSRNGLFASALDDEIIVLQFP